MRPHPGLGPVGPSRWLAIGEDAATYLRDQGGDLLDDVGTQIDVAATVFEALERLEARRPADLVGCFVSSRAVQDRPLDALGQVRARIRPAQMFLGLSGDDETGAKAAARQLGITVVELPAGLADAEAPSPRAPREGANRLPAETPRIVPPAPAAPLAVETAPATETVKAVPRADDDVPAAGVADAGAFATACLAYITKPRELLGYIVRTFSEVSNAGRISLLLSSGGRRSLRLRRGRGLAERLVGTASCPMGSGIAGRAAARGRPTVGHAERGGPREYTGSAYVALPLMHQQRVEGVVCLTGLPGDRIPSEDALRAWRDIAQAAAAALHGTRALQRARAQAVHDALTGLPNRRAFESALRRELERARRSGHRLVVGLFDIDHFSSFNNDYGHDIGDAVLKEVARRLQHAFRETDVVTRWGGEEFAVLLPDLEAQPEDEAADGEAPHGPLALMRRGWAALRARPFDLGAEHAPTTVTASGGFAVFPTHGSEGQELLRLADEALYRAKDEGRDRVCGA